ncbi:MAG: hypothetical protein DHS20C15_13460 [Planctomycetota bacterium]|nr:MAG: hypothetical protein DHS20C15_13460 [Planctomycetota bacterium]
MKPSDHLRWSTERLLDVARQDRRALTALRREAVFALVGLPLLFGLSVLRHGEADASSAIPSFQALALVALVTAMVLWFRQLHPAPHPLPSVDPYAGTAPEADAAAVRARLQESREDLVHCCRELRAAVLSGSAHRATAWWASFCALLLMVLVLALRGLA